MKSPYRSQRFYAGVAAFAGLVWKLLPIEWQQTLAETQAYFSSRLTQGDVLLLGGLFWGFARGLMKSEAVEWKKLVPGRKEK